MASTDLITPHIGLISGLFIGFLLGIFVGWGKDKRDVHESRFKEFDVFYARKLNDQ